MVRDSGRSKQSRTEDLRDVGLYKLYRHLTKVLKSPGASVVAFLAAMVRE